MRWSWNLHWKESLLEEVQFDRIRVKKGASLEKIRGWYQTWVFWVLFFTQIQTFISYREKVIDGSKSIPVASCQTWRSQNIFCEGTEDLCSGDKVRWLTDVKERLYLPQMCNVNIEAPWTEDSKPVLEQNQLWVNLLRRKLNRNDQQNLSAASLFQSWPD